MSSVAQILIVDDDKDFLSLYRELLQKDGLRVLVAHSASEAEEVLSRNGNDLDVVLLDQKLQGPGGPDGGLALIGRANALAPFAKTIVVTGYVTPEAIERAFQAGVYDYLVKNGAFEALLRAKVRNAVEVTSERRHAALSAQAVTAQLTDTWTKAKTETDRNRKGALLETTIKLLFQATPGFERVQTRLRTDSEEIDVVVDNRSAESPWNKDSSAWFLGECKNWSSRCGAAEFRNFHAKLTDKNGKTHTGFFFSTNGFTKDFEQARANQKASETLVVPVDGEGIENWINASDRLRVLSELYRGAVFK